MDLRKDFKEGLETNRVKHILYFFIGVEQFDVFLETAVTVVAHDTYSRPAFFHVGAVFAANTRAMRCSPASPALLRKVSSLISTIRSRTPASNSFSASVMNCS